MASSASATPLVSMSPTPPVGDLPTFADRTHLVTATAPGGGNGTEGSPWTLKEACEQCAPGMIIGVSAGVYVGTKAMGYVGEDGGPEREAAFHPRNTGTEEQPIYFVAEYPAAKTLVQEQYSDLRSGATVLGEGWPVFGCLGYNSRPKADYIHWIGMYSDDRAPNNKLWGGEATISGCWGRGNYSSFRLCRLIRGNELESIGKDYDNKSHFRIDHATYTTFADNHLSIVDCQQAMNNTCWTVYQCSFMTINNNTCVSNTDEPMCINIKAGVSRGRPIEGIRFFNNRVENFAFTIHCTGATKETAGEYYRSHFYGNLAIGAKTFFAWNKNDDYGWSANGLRLFNNTIVNMQNNTESSCLHVDGQT